MLRSTGKILSHSPWRSRTPTALLKPAGCLSARHESTASDLMQVNCYSNVDYWIHEKETVFEALKRMASGNIGCLVATNDSKKVTGVVTERDYLKKVELQGFQSKEISVSAIMTSVDKVVFALPGDSVHDCMGKMMKKDVRHLPVLHDDGSVVGLISMKDLVRKAAEDQTREMENILSVASSVGRPY